MSKLGCFPALIAVAAGGVACSEPKPRPSPPPVVIATGRPEPEAPPAPPAVAMGGDLRGELDPSFGRGGAGLYQHAPSEQRFSQITVLADGSIAAVGYAPFGGVYDMMVVHVLANGALDERFGDRGFLRIGDKRGFGGAITHDARGRILAAGYFYKHGSNDLLIARLDARGELDPSFGVHGLVTRDAGPDDRPHALFVRDDGRVLVAGYYGGSKNEVIGLLSDGTPDTSYGVGGLALFDVGSTAFATAAAMASDGSVVAGGYLPHGHHGFVALLDAHGRPDPRFGENGIVVPETPRISSAWAVAFDARGRILLGGHSDAGPAVVIRFRRDGAVDPSWGSGGVATVDERGDDQLYALSFDARENVVGVGFRSAAEDAQALVVRFGSSGVVDRSFGAGGVWHRAFGGGTFLFDAKWDSGKRLVGGGDVWNGEQSRALLLRLK